MSEKKKENGESTWAWSEKDRRFHGYISVGTKQDGRRRRRHVASFQVPAGLTGKKLDVEKARAEKDVKAKVAKEERLRDEGVKAEGRSLTVGEWLRLYLDTTAKRKVKKSTWIRYDAIARNQLIPVLGRYALEKLEPEHVEAAYGEWEEHLSGSTVLQAHRILSRALKVAVQRRKLSRNVCLLVDAPSTDDRKRAPALTEDERSRLWPEIEKLPPRERTRWILAIALGLRQGETLGLAWDQVDLLAGLIGVQRGLQRIPGEGLVLDSVKSKASRRTLALHPPILAAMKAHKAEQARDRLAAGREWANVADLVFVQANGRPIDPRLDARRWEKLLAAAGIEHRGTHAARRTAASIMAKQGVHVAEAKEVLGHSQVSLTIDLYTDVDPQQSREALGKISEALFPAPAEKARVL